MWAITLPFWAVYLRLLKLLFHHVKTISSFKLFFISPIHIISRRVQFGFVIRKVEYLKLKTPRWYSFRLSMSEPKILTWNLHYHSPSYLAVHLCLRKKLARHVPTPRLSREFCRTIQFSNCLVVCHYHDFSPKQLRSSNLFLIYWKTNSTIVL